ncbi:MAG TPA: hypothetical protein VHI13_19005 [Candidatus Kapabacteria bacterium]|nr:hypothetical protein [Candidatus Kapabacteria bacterium]
MSDLLSLAAERLPLERYGACIDRLERATGFLDCIRDSLEIAADEYDDTLGSRLWVCDYVRSDITEIAGTLRAIGPVFSRALKAGGNEPTSGGSAAPHPVAAAAPAGEPRPGVGGREMNGRRRTAPGAA